MNAVLAGHLDVVLATESRAVARLTPPHPCHRPTLCAPTDGILIGHVRTKLGAAPATVRVTTTVGTTVEHSRLFTSDNHASARVPTETPFHGTGRTRRRWQDVVASAGDADARAARTAS